MATTEPYMDYRRDSVKRWLLQPDPDAGPTSRSFETNARESFPAPTACGCGSDQFTFWRFGSQHKSALWLCSQCNIQVVTDGWALAIGILNGLGSTADQIDRIRREAAEAGIEPLAAVQRVVDFNKEHYAREAFPPPSECLKCAESVWELESVSPNEKSARWVCSYCGRIELAKSAANTSVSRPRDPIPKDVQHEVWRRDQGKCCACGSKENLEFDHIIALSRGGANTARNLQLLCERCNRLKGGAEPGAR